ncbi:MAG: GIY-YIG nuclease family protein [Patescibacteria group bacterium]
MAKTNTMHYAYILKSLKDTELYIGSTGNLKRRFLEHQQGRATSTKHRRPLKLIFYEAFSSKKDAERRELYFKTSKGKSTLKMMLRESLK